jgi:DNA-binding transcriptional LysR family regulator
MNIQNLKYALEINRKKSISKAAKSLYVAQPNLSKSIKELEASCGIKIFKRSSRGVEATKEGQEFLIEAEGIIRKLDELEHKYSRDEEETTELRIAIPRASYIAHAFTNYIMGKQNCDKMTMQVDETSTANAIKQVEDQTSSLGIVRYNLRYDEYFRALFRVRELECTHLMDFSYRLLVSEKSKLLDKKQLVDADLESFIEILHGDNTLPNGEYVDISAGNTKLSNQKRIYVYERGSQFDLLNKITNTFMWVSPMPQDLLDRNFLATIHCDFMEKDMCDMLICRNGHRYTKEEKNFIKEINKVLAEFAIE